jgi:hypothetical protein
MLRKQFLDEVEAIRQPAARTDVFQSIRPENVRRALERAMGLERTDPDGGPLDVRIAMARRA